MTVTNAGTDVAWPDGTTGLLALNGNANLICDTVSEECEVALSGNLKQVLDRADLRGKSFFSKTFANGAVTDDGGIEFNADGSAQFTDADGVSNFDAAVVADYFSEAGWRIDGGVFKARTFCLETSGTREYLIMDDSKDVLSDGSPDNAVSLMVEVAAPK